VQLKDILCQVDPNADKLHDGLLLSKPVVWKLQFDTNVSSGEEESIPLVWVDICLSRQSLIFSARQRATLT